MKLTSKNFKQCFATKGRHRDGGIDAVKGLHLVVKRPGNASWQLRYQLNGKEHWMGLGSARDFNLGEARARARPNRQSLYDRIDPLEAKQASKADAQKARLKTINFRAAAKAYCDHEKADWSDKHAAQFLSSMDDHVFPVLGEVLVSEIDTPLLLSVFERSVPAARGNPEGTFWDARHETARRVRQRIENVLDWSKGRHYRGGDNPASWDVLSVYLPKVEGEVKHFAALSYTDAAAFVANLRAHTGSAARALKFAVLNGSRTNEIIGATWSEIDPIQCIWTVPAERMKGGKEHRVPLSGQAMALLDALPRQDGNPYLFIGNRPGAPMEPRAMYRFLTKLGMKGIATVHGFRSTFSDWAYETTSYPEAIIEMALAHKDTNKIKKTYHRKDLLDKRRRLMVDGASYCTAPAVKAAEVVQLRAKR